MKKILYLSPQNVIPAIDGGKIGIYNPIKELAKDFEVYFAYIDSSAIDTSNVYRAINVKPLRFYMDTSDSFCKVFKNILESIPFKMNKYFSPILLKKLIRLVQQKNINMIIISHAHMAYYALEIKKVCNIPIFLREHNIEYQLVEQYAKYEKNFMKKIIAKWQTCKTKKHEISLWSKFDKVFFISNNDFNEAKKHIDVTNKKYILLYDGYETKGKILKREYEKNSFIFTGSIKTIQNKINLCHFIDNIWKYFLAKVPTSKLYITGNTDEVLRNNIGISMEELSKLNIYNLGFVDNINRVILSKQFFISPTLIGSGIRIKVLHAMSLGVPVIVSEIDFHMVALFQDMKNVILYSDKEDFIQKIEKLQLDSLLLKEIEDNAFGLIRNQLSWKNYADNLIKEIN